MCIVRILVLPRICLLEEQPLCYIRIQGYIKSIRNILWGLNNMINGNTNEFIDKLWGGEEVIFTYNGKKYFSQGYITNEGKYRFELQLWEPSLEVLWSIEDFSRQESLDLFMSEPLFDGKKFWDIEKDIEWVDS